MGTTSSIQGTIKIGLGVCSLLPCRVFNSVQIEGMLVLGRARKAGNSPLPDKFVLVPEAVKRAKWQS
jgi:hypothetical protein